MLISKRISQISPSPMLGERKKSIWQITRWRNHEKDNPKDN